MTPTPVPPNRNEGMTGALGSVCNANGLMDMIPALGFLIWRQPQDQDLEVRIAVCQAFAKCDTCQVRKRENSS